METEIHIPGKFGSKLPANEPMHKPSASLIIVAILFFLMGVSSAIGIVEKYMAGSLFVDFGVLGLFIGPGLLRRKLGWRNSAFVFIWIGMIFSPIIAAVFMYMGGPLDLTIFGRKIGQAPVSVGVGIGVAVFVVNLWMFRVLIRPDVRDYFGLSPKLGTDAAKAEPHGGSTSAPL